MRISHGDAITLEIIVRHVHDCDRAGMGDILTLIITSQTHLMPH